MTLSAKRLWLSLLSLCVLIGAAIWLFSGNTPVSPQQTGTSLTGQQASSEPPLYTVKEWNGRVAVFQGKNETPLEVMDVYVSTLPADEREVLRAGVPANSEDALARLIENYSG